MNNKKFREKQKAFMTIPSLPHKSKRYCNVCEENTTWIYNKKIIHSCCQKCGSRFGSKLKQLLTKQERRIERQAQERFERLKRIRKLTEIKKIPTEHDTNEDKVNYEIHSFLKNRFQKYTEIEQNG